MPWESLIWNSSVGWIGPVAVGLGVGAGPSALPRPNTAQTRTTAASRPSTTPETMSSRRRESCDAASAASSAARRRAARLLSPVDGTAGSLTPGTIVAAG